MKLFALAIFSCGFGATQQAEMGPEAERVLGAFRVWAERVADVSSIHFDFRSSYFQLEDHSVYSGKLDLDAAHGRVFLEVRSHDATTLSPNSKEYASWSDGVGYSLNVRANGGKRTVVKKVIAPQMVGRSHMPSDHPYYPGLVSLATFLGGKEASVERLPKDHNLYRIGVLQGERFSKDLGIWHVYVIRPDSPAMILEQRLYFTQSPPIPEEYPFLPQGLELPAEYNAKYLHVRKVLKEFKTIGQVAFPTRWEVFMPAMQIRAEIEVIKDTFQVDVSPDHEYKVPIKEGDVINDRGSGLHYLAGFENALHPLPTGGSICESQIDVLLQQARVKGLAANSEERNIYYPWSCAANCVYGMLFTLRKPQPLYEIHRRIGSRPGDPFSDLSQVTKCLRQSGVESLTVKDDKECLRKTGNVPALVHLDKSKGHFLLVRDYRLEDDSVQVIDVPLPVYRESVNAIYGRSPGVVLLCDPKVLRAVSEEIASGEYQSSLLLFGSILLIGIALTLTMIRIRKASR